jgi:hypothetical protein
MENDFEEIAARQNKLLEDIQNLRQSAVTIKDLEEIEARERKILAEIESLKNDYANN